MCSISVASINIKLKGYVPCIHTYSYILTIVKFMPMHSTGESTTTIFNAELN